MTTPKRPWWQQATALVSLSAGGAVTGFAFAPKAAAAACLGVGKNDNAFADAVAGEFFDHVIR